jgi:hypothetical protein
VPFEPDAALLSVSFIPPHVAAEVIEGLFHGETWAHSLPNLAPGQ